MPAQQHSPEFPERADHKNESLLELCHLKPPNLAGDETLAGAVNFIRGQRGIPETKDLIEKARLYYQMCGWPLTNLSRQLSRLQENALDPTLLRLVKGACALYEKKRAQLGALFSAAITLNKFVECGSLDAHRIKVEHLVLFARARSFVAEELRHENVAQPNLRALVRQLADETCELLNKQVLPHELKLFYETRVWLLQLGIRDEKLPAAFCDLVEADIDRKQLALLWPLVTRQVALAALPSDAIEQIADFSKSSSYGLLQEVQTPEVLAAIYNVVSRLCAKGWSLEGLIRQTVSLAARGATPALLYLFARAVKFHEQHGTDYERSKIANYLKHAALDRHSDLVIAALNQAYDTGQIKTSTQSLELLKNLAINSLATAMFRGANAIIREKAESGLASLVPAAASNPNDTANEQYGSRTAWTNWILGYRHGVIPLEGVLQPHQREALFFFQQALDLHKGFGSMAVDSRRTPDREPPLLARFGADIGKVKYVNARDINQFPGRGFLIACLDLDRALVADKRFDIRDKRRYARYAEAWPDLADELVDLRHAQFMLTRGMVVISSNPRSKYSLKMPSGSWVHYSLVIFNDHFHNFPPVIALLVPTEVLQKKCKGAFVSYEDFRGFDLQKKDINTERITPQGLIEDSKDYGYGAIEFTGARALTLGLAGLLVNFHGPYQQLLRTRAKLYREWNRNPALHYHDEGDVLGYSITAIETEIERVFNSIINPGGAANGNQLRKLLSRYFNEWTLFKVIKGLWGKGETAGKVEGQEFEPLPDQLEPQWDQNQEAAFNPAATRMLREAYRWHAERAPGHGEKSAKVLVAASSLDYSSLPNSPFFLNTADMTVKFGDRLVRLPIDSDGSGIDEQIFWRSEIMSHMSDTFTEFRFLEGQVFGIH